MSASDSRWGLATSRAHQEKFTLLLDACLPQPRVAAIVVDSEGYLVSGVDDVTPADCGCDWIIGPNFPGEVDVEGFIDFAKETYCP